MSHYAYSPVGYSFNADDYCLDCIPQVAAIAGKGNGGNGSKRGECNCAECRLDRMAAARGINRMDERTFDSGDFPKHIPYHNDIHSECGPDHYQDEDHPSEWSCYARCGKCHKVIDGTSNSSGPDTCPSMPEPAETEDDD